MIMDESIRSFMNVVDNNNILEENDEEFYSLIYQD